MGDRMHPGMVKQRERPQLMNASTLLSAQQWAEYTFGSVRLGHQARCLRQPAPKGETAWERKQRERESQVWERSVQAIGSPPPGVQWIHVGDRGSDMFPLLSLCRQLQCDFVVRAAQDRNVDLLV